MTRETYMATPEDMKRIKHHDTCEKLKNGKSCSKCKKYGFTYFICKKCQVIIVYVNEVKNHVCIDCE